MNNYYHKNKINTLGLVFAGMPINYIYRRLFICYVFH